MNDIASSNEHRPIFRMPAVLGPASGPRNMPRSKAHLRFDGDTKVLTVSARTDEAELRSILPERCTLLDGPRVDVTVMCQKNLGWLAGRGYNIVVLRIPVVFEGRDGPLKATFTPILWENMADPVLTGREELGSPKLFATIPDPVRRGDSYAATAEWEGFRFFEMEIDELVAADGPPPPGMPNLLYRYFSRTGEWEKADVAQMTRSVPGEAPAPRVSNHHVGNGRFTFHPARWEDMPTQYTYINRLAALPLHSFGPARYYELSGIVDLAAQKIVE